jgi:CheY-like chemotaxis protein
MDTANGSARILIVEDETLVRMFAVDALEDAGFKVEQAGDAAEALEVLQQVRAVAGASSGNGHGISAAVIDLGLPDRSGDQLAADMRALYGDLPLLIASGRSERELKDRFSSDRYVGVLMKPYTAPMLIDSLASLGVRAS